MKIAQDSRYRGNDWWDWSVWIEGTSSELDQIDEVTWRLHPTFSPSKVTKRDRTTGFRLDTSGWGTFTIRADLKLTNRSSQTLKHELEL